MFSSTRKNLIFKYLVCANNHKFITSQKLLLQTQGSTLAAILKFLFTFRYVYKILACYNKLKGVFND